MKANDPAALRCLDQFKELIFCDAYYPSSYFHPDYVYRAREGTIDQAIPVFPNYQTGRSLERW
ncbi:MAG: hypothetical protein WCS90_04945 [Bacilli bacterium]